MAKIHLDLLTRNEFDSQKCGGNLAEVVEMLSSHDMGVSREKFCHESVYILDEAEKTICIVRRAKSRWLQLFFVPNWTEQTIIAVDTRLEYSVRCPISLISLYSHPSSQTIKMCAASGMRRVKA